MRYKKGFTLLEVIISIAIFAVVSVALISAFSSGMIGIYVSGNKTRAVEQVQGYMDSVWEASRNGGIKTATVDTDIKDILGSGNYCSDPSNLFLSEGKDMKFYYKTDEVINGRNYTEITIVVFYQNRNRNVSLTSIIPVGGV
jgi:prepilin-type N-terminal cleavage/methylation domain-containing protein